MRHLDAVAVGQHEVDDRRRRRLQRGLVERLLGRRGLQHLEARLAQDDAQRAQDLGLVVDDEYARTVVHGTLSLRMAGHYKIFLGMAAGVGKTYRMLAEAQAQAEAGRDVVIGLLETHGRAETAALAEGLELLPRRRVPVPRRDAGGDGPARASSPARPSCA